MMRTHSRSSGFTLIELLMVVVIIGLLAAIAIPKFSATRERAFLSSIRADLRNLASQQDVYYNEHYTYSSNTAALGFASSEGVVVTFSEATNTGWSASGAHPGIPDESCAIYHGGAAQLTPATVHGTVQCSR